MNDIIIRELNVLYKNEQQNRQPFKARAYAKVIQQIRDLDVQITSWDDLQQITGIGEKIRAKIDEIFATGKLQAADRIRQETSGSLFDNLMKIYGVGTAKAKELIEKHKVASIHDLCERQDELLNDKQRIGLMYYSDLQNRIPREEMLRHERFIKEIVATISDTFEVDIVGSFRRGSLDSGDIDVLLRLPASCSQQYVKSMFTKVCDTFQEMKYILHILAKGDKKCMGVCRLDGMDARRIDLLMTPYHEYPYALLYFTGSDDFNVAMRKHARSKGYTLNEHGMKKINDEAIDIPTMENENDIFSFLKIPYYPPEQRAKMKNL